MLVLTRKVDEKVIIGEGIVITVIAIRGARVHLGIKAPAEVSIQRQELGRSNAPTDQAPALPAGKT